jgi:hypothetical protein
MLRQPKGDDRLAGPTQVNGQPKQLPVLLPMVTFAAVTVMRMMTG